MVEFGASSAAASAPSAASASERSTEPRRWSSSKAISPVVMVPVLSRHNTSTRARTSTVESCLASALRRESSRTPATKARLVRRTRPSGTMATAAATVPWRASCQRSSATSSLINSRPDAIGMMIVSHLRMRSTPWRSCDSAALNVRASIVSSLANPASPTAVARATPDPATTKLPESSSSPGVRMAGSDSPVRRDSSSCSPVAVSTVPSTGTWPPGTRTIKSSSTTSVASMLCRSPSRMTVVSGWVSTRSFASSRLALTSWVTPTTAFDSTTPTKTPSLKFPEMMMRANSTNMIAFTGVSALARTIWRKLRPGGSQGRFTSPASIRCSTSDWVSPLWTSIS